MRNRQELVLLANPIVRSMIALLMMVVLTASAHGSIFLASALALLEAEDCTDSENSEEQTRETAPKLHRLRSADPAHAPRQARMHILTPLAPRSIPFTPGRADHRVAKRLGAGVALRC